MAGRMGEVEALLARSKRFLNLASMCVEERMFDLACFIAHQSVQLLLKALTLKRLGYIPRIHGIRELMGKRTLDGSHHGKNPAKTEAKTGDMGRGYIRRLSTLNANTETTTKTGGG